MKTDANLSQPGVKIVAAGDVMIKRPLPANVFRQVKSVFSGADILFCNLESPLSDRGTPVLGKPVTLRSSPDTIEELVDAGFDIVSLANNHALDFGYEALLDTLSLLEKKGIQSVGAGLDMRSAAAPIVVAKPGFSVAFLSYCCALPRGFAATPVQAGVASIRVRTAYEPAMDRLLEQPGVSMKVHTWVIDEDMRALTEAIKVASQDVNGVAVSFHWGVAFDLQPIDYQRQLAYAAIDAGADFVIGHHPHIPQQVENYNGRWICYSLGNLVFDYKDPRFDSWSVLAECVLTANGIRSLALVPVGLDPRTGTPYIASGRQADDVFSKMQALCRELETKLSYDEKEGRIICG